MSYSYEEFKYDYEEMLERRSKDLKEFQAQYPEYTQKYQEEIRNLYKNFFKQELKMLNAMSGGLFGIAGLFLVIWLFLFIAMIGKKL